MADRAIRAHGLGPRPAGTSVDRAFETDLADGDMLLRTHYPPRSDWRSGTAHIDLVVLVPLRIELEIGDSSGEVLVSGTGVSMDLVGVDGSVLIESDGSGSIAVRDIGRDFVVQRDGSGGIRHSGVDGRIDIPRRR